MEVSCHTEVPSLCSIEANLISASAGARCFATVEKLLVSVTQPGEQYRGLWKGCIIPGAFRMVFHGFYRMLAHRPLQKAVSEFDKISPLLILSLMDFVSCLPEWVPPTFFYVYPSASPRNLVLIACFWIFFFFARSGSFARLLRKSLCKKFFISCFFEGRAFPALFPLHRRGINAQFWKGRGIHLG